ncbi:hemerythrin domain-containing protein [Arthrobacter sp. TMN-37]
MQIDPSAPTNKPETQQMVVIHKALRREFALLPGIVGRVPDRDTHRAGVVADHARLTLRFLHEHHESEDRLLWPVLEQRVPLEQGLVEAMEAQHTVVADLIASLEAELAHWRTEALAGNRDRIVPLLTRLDAALGEHLDAEEESVLPLIHENLTVAEWDAPVKDAAANMPKDLRSRLMLAGMVLESADDRERAWFLNELPAPARLLWKLVGIRMYGRYVSAIRA